MVNREQQTTKTQRGMNYKSRLLMVIFLVLINALPVLSQPIYITEINVSGESLLWLEVHMYDAATDDFLGCAHMFGCTYRGGVLYEIESVFLKPNGLQLALHDISNSNIFLRVIKNDTTATCPAEAEIPPDRLVATSGSIAGNELSLAREIQFGAVNHLKLGAVRAPLPPAGSPEVDIKEIEVTGINDGIGRLEIEVHLHEEGTNRFLACSGQINGLEGVDHSGTLYNVDARFQMLRNRNLTYFDLQDKSVYAVVIEDDLAPCPCEPGAGDDGVATSNPFPGTDLQAAKEITNIGNLKRLVIGLAGMPDRVVLAVPGHFSEVRGDDVAFSWLSAAGATQYQLQLATDSLMINLIIDSTVAATSLTLPNDMVNLGFRWWRVRAKNNVGWGLFSRKNFFIYLGPATGIDDLNPIVGEFRLEQNYPNPFNPTTNIGFVISDGSTSLTTGSVFVELKVYDTVGRLVKTLVNENREAGVYTAQWDATNEQGQRVTSGLYVYRITAGEYTGMKKMVLLK